ncbi:MAG: Gfo/Idh/MocA family oxidoreductase [Abitibacteriaceae bacterium]|nr:Gfo/Idh/MocA family oxidoreductase [Abditibacteriaceae bacterium]MBV9864959.1 Gfo/Idh/MocA family oxidoreductase [Abditibacteriaceae bacterium]
MNDSIKKSKPRCLMIGAGGMAHHWLHQAWAPFRDRMEFAALVDVNPATLDAAGDFLELPASRRFNSAAAAFEQVEADFCCIVSPPQFHREAVELACAAGMNILSEKPIADTWEACCAIYRAVQQAGVKMMVTQNYRYEPRILTLKQAINELGTINYVVARYATDWRVRNSHYIRTALHPLLTDCAIHHFDQIRNLSGANCQTISGYEWNPGSVRSGHDQISRAAQFSGADAFDGGACALFVMQMQGGSFVQYEGSNIASASTNTWHHEYYRVECEDGAAVLDRDDIVRIETRGTNGALQVREVPPEKPAWEGHQAITQQFLNWLDGGPAPATILQDNLQSNAIMFAAIQASEQGTAVDVQQLMQAAMS